MTLILAKEYFSKLLSISVDESTVIRLSSGQAARAHTWLKTNNFNLDSVSQKDGFTLQQLIGGLQGESTKINIKNSEIKNFSSELHNHSNSVIGIDIQSIDELFPLGLPMDPKSDVELLGIFTIKELSYAQSNGHPLQTLTGIFAAKEAAQKCTQNKMKFTDIEILPDHNGRPSADGFTISISHSRDYAVAIAVFNIKNLSDHLNPPQPAMGGESIYLSKSQTNAEKSNSKLIMPTLISLLLLWEIVKFFSIVKGGL